MIDPDQTQPGKPPHMADPDDPTSRRPKKPAPAAPAAPDTDEGASDADDTDDAGDHPAAHAGTVAPTDPGHRWKILLRRARHSDLEPIEILPDEVAPFDTANVHGGSEPLKRILLWRRAALLVAFLFQMPPLAVRFVKAIIGFGKDAHDVFSSVELVMVLLEVAVLFAILASMRRWSSWQRSRRLLFWTWVVSFTGPFVMALVPYRNSFPDVPEQGKLLVGMAMGIGVFIQLAPKVLALIPGILRACVIAKAAFPMSPLPGWVIMVAAPFDALLMFVVINMAYQMGGPALMPALVLLSVAPVFFYLGGKRLAGAHSLDEALALIGKMRFQAIIANVLGGVALVIGLLVTVGAQTLPDGSHPFGVTDFFLPVFSLVAGIFLLEVIGIDLMLDAMVRMHKSRTERPEMRAAEAAYAAEIDVLAAAIEADSARPTTAG